MRKPWCVEDDVGLACIAKAETNNSSNNNKQNPFFTRSRKSPSYISLSSLSSTSTNSSSPRSTRFYEAKCKDPHFLESCFLCKKPLGDNRDIFMYRGDAPFCSEECRDEQIEVDEAMEKNLKFSAAMKKKQTKTASNKSRNYQMRTSTVAAA